MKPEDATVPTECFQPKRPTYPPEPTPLDLLPAALRILRCSARAFLSSPASRPVSMGRQPVWMDGSST